MTLCQLVYCSTAVDPFSDAEITALAEESSNRNAGRDVTGELFYSGGTIMQILEGEHEVVESLFEKIAEDERHAFVEVVFKGECAERLFPKWNMGLCVLSPEKALPPEEFMAVSRLFKLCPGLDAHVISRGLKTRFEELASNTR